MPSHYRIETMPEVGASEGRTDTIKADRYEVAGPWLVFFSGEGEERTEVLRLREDHVVRIEPVEAGASATGDGQGGPRAAVVTGAGGTIGRLLALELARRGADVLAVDVSLDAARAVEKEAEAEGLSCVAHAADVSDEQAVAGYAREAVERWGRIDWFANNAGIEGPAAPIADFPTAAFRQVLDVNVIGVFLGLKYVLPVMRQGGGGSIVNTASVAGLFATPQVVAYGASKHAVVGMTRTAAIEHATDGIRVNAICPGPLEGRMMESIESNLAPGDAAGARSAYLAAIPAGRYGHASEIVATMAWLLSEAPPYLTGQAIAVDGGLLVS